MLCSTELCGGGGSIGSELCRQISRLGPEKLIIVERGEFALYSIESELKNSYPDLVLSACLVDVCDAVAVDYFYKKYHQELRFHQEKKVDTKIMSELFKESPFDPELRRLLMKASFAQKDFKGTLKHFSILRQFPKALTQADKDLQVLAQKALGGQ